MANSTAYLLRHTLIKQKCNDTLLKSVAVTLFKSVKITLHKVYSRAPVLFTAYSNALVLSYTSKNCKNYTF